MSAGRVNQALSGAIRQVLKDYFVFVAELEAQHKRGELTLNKVRTSKASNSIDFRQGKRCTKLLPSDVAKCKILTTIFLSCFENEFWHVKLTIKLFLK